MRRFARFENPGCLVENKDLRKCAKQMPGNDFENNVTQIKKAFGFVFESLREIQEVAVSLKSEGCDEERLDAAVASAGFRGLDVDKLIAAKTDKDFSDLLMLWVQILVARYDSSASALTVDANEPC